jgi:hypothetical protein
VAVAQHFTLSRKIPRRRAPGHVSVEILFFHARPLRSSTAFYSPTSFSFKPTAHVHTAAAPPHDIRTFHAPITPSVPHSEVEAPAKQVKQLSCPVQRGDRGKLPAGRTKCSSIAAAIQRATSTGVLSCEDCFAVRHNSHRSYPHFRRIEERLKVTKMVGSVNFQLDPPDNGPNLLANDPANATGPTGAGNQAVNGAGADIPAPPRLPYTSDPGSYTQLWLAQFAETSAEELRQEMET